MSNPLARVAAIRSEIGETKERSETALKEYKAKLDL